MPITVDRIFKELKLDYSKPHKWNEKLDANFNGVYIISTSNNPKENSKKFNFEICDDVFSSWLREAPNLEIDGLKVVTKEQVKTYLWRFWNPQECILYIGESTSPTNPIQKRVNQFYSHKVGQKGPHTGGYWIKLLASIKDLYIYFAPAKNPRETEFKLIMRYVELTSEKSFYELENLANFFPFANSKVDLLKHNSIRYHTNTNKRSKKNKL